MKDVHLHLKDQLRILVIEVVRESDEVKKEE
jgi:hypothetical protein